MESKKLCIAFAGPVGSGKSPIAGFLSCKLGLPIFNNDLIRKEVTEDLLHFDNKVYLERKKARLGALIESRISFIFDASVDRHWEHYEPLLDNADYKIFLVSLDFSKEKLTEQYQAKNYTDFEALERTYQEHQKFLSQYSAEVDLSLKDRDFIKRMEITLEAIKNS